MKLVDLAYLFIKIYDSVRNVVSGEVLDLYIGKKENRNAN